MVVTSGLNDADPLAAHRKDVCQFSDARLSPAQKLDFIHGILGREAAEARMFLERIERYTASLKDSERQTPAVADALERIVRDEPARTRYLDFARDADQLAVRARMLELARSLGWLSQEEQRAEIMLMIGDQLAHSAVTPADVDVVCALNKDHELDLEIDRLQLPVGQAQKLPQAGILACLGSPEAHARVLQALTSGSDADVQIAQVYLRQRPIDDPQELRAIAANVARMNGSEAKVRALETLARLRLNDRESLESLARLYPVAESAGVQTAIAAVLIRGDYQTIAGPSLVQSLREHRLKSGTGPDVIDVLIRRLQSP
jgi:ABC-type thiamine transport system ATPase subunit